jgi:hypothetical protein
MKGIIMENNQKFVITYTKQNGESVTRDGKWTAKCKEWICAKGYACLSYLDLDATETKGKDQYRMATAKITPWSMK